MQTAFDLTTTPATPVQRRTALLALAGIFSIAAFVLPFVRWPLSTFSGFVPALCGSLVVMDFVTAALLLRQAALSRRLALVLLAAGFFVTGALIVAYMLAFPGALEGLSRRAGAQAPSWLWVCWHLTVPLAVAVYVATAGQTRERLPFATVTAGAPLLGLLAAAGVIAAAPFLPAYSHDGVWDPFVPHVIEPLMFVAVGSALA
ncbi:MAG: MASE4 domain-containing protein, partial [Candidatus Velthaea sp.]